MTSLLSCGYHRQPAQSTQHSDKVFPGSSSISISPTSSISTSTTTSPTASIARRISSAMNRLMRRQEEHAAHEHGNDRSLVLAQAWPMPTKPRVHAQEAHASRPSSPTATATTHITPLERRRRELRVQQGLSRDEYDARTLYRRECAADAIEWFLEQGRGGVAPTYQQLTDVLDRWWLEETAEIRQQFIKEAAEQRQLQRDRDVQLPQFNNARRAVITRLFETHYTTTWSTSRFTSGTTIRKACSAMAGAPCDCDGQGDMPVHFPHCHVDRDSGSKNLRYMHNAPYVGK